MKLVSLQKQKPRAEQISFNKNSRELFEELCDFHHCEEGKPSAQYVQHETVRAYELLLSKFEEFAPMLQAIERGAKAWERQFSVGRKSFTTKTIDDLLVSHNVLSNGGATHSVLMLPAGYASVETEDDSALLQFSEIYKAVKLGDETIPVLDTKNKEELAKKFDEQFYSAQKIDVTETFKTDAKEILAEVLLPWHAVASDEQAFGKMLGLLEKYHPEVYVLLEKNFAGKEGISDFIESYAQRSLEEDISAKNLEEKVSVSVARRISAPMIAGLMALAGGAAAAATAGSAGAASTSESEEIVKDLIGDIIYAYNEGEYFGDVEIDEQIPNIDIHSVESKVSGATWLLKINLGGAPDIDAQYIVELHTNNQYKSPYSTFASLGPNENKISYPDGTSETDKIIKTPYGLEIHFDYQKFKSSDYSEREYRITAKKKVGDISDIDIITNHRAVDFQAGLLLDLFDTPNDLSMEELGSPPTYTQLGLRWLAFNIEQAVIDTKSKMSEDEIHIRFSESPILNADRGEMISYVIQWGDMSASILSGAGNFNTITYGSANISISNAITLYSWMKNNDTLRMPYDRDIIKPDKTFGDQLRVTATYAYVDPANSQNMLVATDVLNSGNSAPIDKQIVNQTPSQPPTQPPVQPPSQSQTTKYIIHLTDTHIGAQGNGDDSRLSQTVSKILSLPQKPDYVVVTGDVADFGVGAEGMANYQKFLELVRPLENAGIKVVTVPGNHDYREKNDVLGSAPYVGGLESLFDTRLKNYKDTVGDRDISGKVVGGGNYVLIGLDSGHDILLEPNYPLTAPRGSGLKDSQVAWLENVLDNLDGVKNGKDTSGKAKIIVMHHPGYNKFILTQAGVIDKNQEQFLSLLNTYGVDAVLAGHHHQNDFDMIDRTKHTQTASVAYEGTWRIIGVKQDGSSASVAVYKPLILGKTMTVRAGSPVDVQVVDSSGNAVVPQASSVFAVDSKGSKQTEVSFDYKEGYKVRVTGTRDATPTSTYNLEIAINSEDNSTPLVSGQKIGIGKGAVHEYSVDWGAVKSNSPAAVTLRIDANGDGRFEETITQDKAITADEVREGKSNTASAAGGNATVYIIGGAAILAVAGGVAYYFRGRRGDGEGGRETETLDTVVETRANRGSLGQENRERLSLEDAAGNAEPEAERGLEKELETPEAQIRHYSALAEKSPGKPGHWYRLAKAYSSSGKWDEAKAAIDKAIEVAGGDKLKPEYFDLAAQACKALGKPKKAQKARECAEELRKLSSENN